MSFRAILGQVFDNHVNTRLARTALVALVAAFPAGALAQGSAWRSGPQLPAPRTEVAGTYARGELVVAGGYLADGTTTARVDAYRVGGSWRRLPDLPRPVNHAAAATWNGAVIVVGGYSPTRSPSRAAWILHGEGWRALPPLPAGRGAAGAAVLGATLYVVGGVGPRGLARAAFALDFDRRRLRWRTIPAPTPREHLGVAAGHGRIYAVAGRTAGLDTNVRIVEAYRPGARRWTRIAPVPEARGGTGAAVVGPWLVSAGGESPTGTTARVFGYRPATRRWARLPDLPTARHGAAVVGEQHRVYVIGGGPRPGLSVSGANESLALAR